MTDWPVMSYGEMASATRILNYTEATALDWHEMKRVLEAQVKQVGELADAVIVWMCYFAQRQGMGIIIDWLEQYAVHGGRTDLSLVLDDMKIHSFLYRQALRGKGE